MGHHPKKNPAGNLTSKQRLNLKRKDAKKHSREKKARLIVRNLPFKATEENLQEHYSKFGEVKEVKLLRRPDGKLVGCGFIQFKEVQKAAKARHHTNGQPFLGRNIECDWALSKNKFVEKKGLKTEIKEEPVEIKEEPTDGEKVDLDVSCVTVKSEDEAEEDKKIETKDEDDIKSEHSEDSFDEKSDEEDEVKHDLEDRNPRVESNDVTEGKTVFVKNIPFTATNEDLKECMLQYGPVYYALICIDRNTEHSKGTGFVKFVNIESAEACLQAGTELKLLGNILDCHKALNRNEVLNKKDKKEDKQKDSRNLYLVKEGVVMAGSKAAEGISATDMAKRLQLEQYKTQMLRNLNMFISKTRLVVHNLPASWDDSKLRQLLQRHAGNKAVIREARIMRDMKKLDSNGVGASKEFGFVTFTTHEHALQALRSLNNNPNIFSANKRPIVAFSIENKNMVKAKEKRLMNSRKYNPKSKEFDPKLIKEHREQAEAFKNKNKLEENEEHPNKKGKRKRKNDKRTQGDSKIAKSETKPQNPSDDGPEFAGVAAKPGISKMRSRYKLKTQAQIHHQHLKDRKKKLKLAKKSLTERKKDFIRQPSQKINKKGPREDDTFSKMVNNYKQKILSATTAVKNKWYEAT